MEQRIPLSHEASAGDTNMRVTTSLPPEVVQCLENARFLHLATCSGNVPHVSLMNYTYLPSSPYSRAPVIIMTTNLASKKMNNLASNPNVSLLVHDWVSHRPTPTAQARRLSSGSASRSPNREPHSSLAALLFNLNTSAVSSISATIGGSARLVERGTDEERYYRDVHLENNTFDDDAGGGGGGGGAAGGLVVDTGLFSPTGVRSGGGGGEGGEGGDGQSGRSVAEDDVRVIVVGIRDVRIADRKGAVSDWVIEPPPAGVEEGSATVNGVR